VDRLPFWHEDITHVESWPLIRRLLPGSHTVRVEARVVSGRPTGGDPDGVEIPVLGGDVQMDGTAKVRSTLQLITDGKGMWPRAKNTLLAPYGNEVFVRYGIDLGSHVKWWPLGYFRIQSPEQDQAPDGPIRLSGQDRMAGIIRGRFLVPRQYQATDTYGDVVSDLVGDIYPNAVIAWDDNTYLNMLGRSVVFEEDRYGALRDLVDSLGKIAWWDEWGILRIATAPDPDEILWEVEAGKNGVLLESGRRLSDEAVRNAWVYIGEGTDNLSPARGVAVDDNPRSPTWFYGDFGQVPGFHASPLLLTPAQARNAALARLRRTTGLISSVDFGVVTNPILRPYDPIRIRQKDRNRERHVVERVVIPLTPGQNMTGTTREQTFAGGGVVL